MMRLVLLALLVAGCKHDDPGPPCGQVADHVLELMKQGLTGHEALALGDRKATVELCEKRPFSRDTRTCLLAATDLDAMARCQRPAGSGTIEAR